SAVVVCTAPVSPPPRTTETFTGAGTPSSANPSGTAPLQDPHFLPGRAHRPVFGAGRAEQVAGRPDGGVGRRPEVAVGLEPFGQRHVPDLPGRLPGVPADGGGRQVEGPVGNAGVDVDAAVVVLRVVVVGEVGVPAHRAGLAVEVVGRARRL